jgi:hypothetical protein
MRWVSGMNPKLGLTVVAICLLFMGWCWASEDSDPSDAPVPVRSWSALPRTVELEVLNAGGIRGAARDAAIRLRRGGLDVVQWGNAAERDMDTVNPRVPRILVRTGDTVGVGRVMEILGHAEVVEAPDDRNLVDLTVLIWRDSTP